MKIAIFGGTGFIGSYICDALIESGRTPRLLVRSGSERKVEQPEKCEQVTGEIKDEDAVAEMISGCDAVVYSIGLIRECSNKGITFEAAHFHGVRSCVEEAERQNVKRFVLISALGVKSSGTAYQTTKHLGEQVLKNSGLEWIILRPSTVFGDPRGRIEFCSQLKKEMLNLPIPAPMFFNGFIPRNAGAFGFSPIHVKDVAGITVKMLAEKEGWEKTVELGGPGQFTWKEMIKMIAKSYGKNKWTMPVPAWGIKSAAAVLDRFAWFPITCGQVTMLMESSICDSSEIFDRFEMKPIPFNIDNLAYLQNDSVSMA